MKRGELGQIRNRAVTNEICWFEKNRLSKKGVNSMGDQNRPEVTYTPPNANVARQYPFVFKSRENFLLLFGDNRPF